ncbi:diguanylate cyclase [Rhodoferax sp. BLA1]|uniref:GGDEF domain-containing protein n=1 Tax=Rhodoferax sp. BLA1 TaxID=2576062 RepID=UPI0015D17E4A|nr:GGDEF domain-containing protein [Rhodoferax sp. BLA1]
MQGLDPKTIVFISAIMSAMTVLVLYGAHFAFHREVGGIRSWTIASVLVFVASWCIVLRGRIPDFISIVVANNCLLAGYWLMIRGTRELNGDTGVPIHWWRVGVYIGFCTAWLTFWTYADPNFIARVVLVSCIACGTYAYLCLLAFRTGRSPLNFLFAIGMFLGVVTTAARMVTGIASWGSASEEAQLPSPNAINIVYLGAYSLLSVLHPVSFFLLAARKQRFVLVSMASTDFLTGAMNRRGLVEKANPLIQLAERKGHDTSLIMMDLDHFKKINDSFGHERGDQALRHFSEAIRGLIRQSDLFARIGGEEFVLLLPETRQDKAMVIANRIHSMLNRSRSDGVPPYTASIGVATAFGGDFAREATSETMLERLIKIADDAAYKAKKNGRNRIELAEAFGIPS